MHAAALSVLSLVFLSTAPAAGQILFESGSVELAVDAERSMSIADLDSDGRPDVVVLGRYDSVDDVLVVLVGSGDGMLRGTQRLFLPISEGAVAIAVADVVGDAAPDLLVAERQPPRVRLFEGSGDGTFAA